MSDDSKYLVTKTDYDLIQEAIAEEEINYQLFEILEERTDLDAYFMGGRVTNEYE